MAGTGTGTSVKGIRRKKKPKFIRQQNLLEKFRHRKKEKWRKPKGMHSKLRRSKSGHRKKPSPGYGSDRRIRAMHPSGMKVVYVHSVSELQAVKDKSREGILVHSTVGLKKKMEIIKKAKESGIKVLNFGDSESFVRKKQEWLESRKKKQKKTEEKKQKFAREAEKRAKSKDELEKTEAEKTTEEKETEAKMEKRRVLEDKNSAGKGGMVA
jgi:large subunit ribosomal protein L32e